jgi:hypothetical protein
VTIRKGEPWGEPGPLAPGAPAVTDDRAAAEVLQARWRAGGEPVQVGLLGGELHRLLGSPRRTAAELLDGAGHRYPMDLGTVRIDGGEPLVFVGGLVATGGRRRRWWSTRTVTAMNGQYASGFRLAPRAHPDDGRLDVADGRLPRRERRAGRRRALTGSHLPHPDLRERRVEHLEVVGEHPFGVHLDGVLVGRGRHLELRCHPDAWIAVA